MIDYKLILNNNCLCSFKHILIENDNFIYLTDGEIESDIELSEGEKIILTGSHFSKIHQENSFLIEFTLKLKKNSYLKKGMNFLMLEAEILDLYDPTWYPYDQNQINLLYLWQEKNNYIELIKDQSLFAITCMFVNGMPNSFPFNKKITIDCSLIRTEIHFYTIFAERIFGYGLYIGHDAFSFIDCLKYTNVSSKNNITIILKDINVMKNRFKNFDDIFIDFILKTLKQFGIKIELN